MCPTLRRGVQDAAVERLQRALHVAGFSPGAVDSRFGPATEAALIAFQRAQGLLADGIAGPLTWVRLVGAESTVAGVDVTDQVTIDLVADMFPFTRLDSLARHLPVVLAALRRFGVVETPMVLMALATIRAETETFEPTEELPSRFNTSPGGHPFDLYDNRTDLGNSGRPDGERFRGRGFVQLTGRASYAHAGRLIGMGDRLERRPEDANAPATAAAILAAFLAARRLPLKEALLEDDLVRARRLANGGRHGLERFVHAYRVGLNRLVDEVWRPQPAVAAYPAAAAA
jgi:peptidoglycan L-alanyl-D-glutamate endopeptidase CwlK